MAPPCPGRCLDDCTCAPPPSTPILRAVGPSVLHNATSFGVQAFGVQFLPGAQLELLDAGTSAVVITLPTTWVSSHELTALVPAGLPVPAGIQRELTARVINPGGIRSGTPSIGHCITDRPDARVTCTMPSASRTRASATSIA